MLDCVTVIGCVCLVLIVFCKSCRNNMVSSSRIDMVEYDDCSEGVQVFVLVSPFVCVCVCVIVFVFECVCECMYV